MKRLLVALVRFFPVTFRERFGPAIVEQIERDYDVARARGPRHAVSFILASAADLIGSALAERWHPAWNDARSSGLIVRRGEVTRSLLSEVQVSLRTLRRQPGFAAVAITTLALGLGTAVAVAGVVDSVLLTPLPYPDPDRLLRVELSMPRHPDVSKRRREYLSVPWVVSLGRQSVLSGVAAMNTYRELGADLTDRDTPERIRLLPVSPNFFQVLGVAPALGPGFASAADGDPLAILAHGLWVRAFGADPGVVGRSIRLDGVSYRVVGVMPAGLQPVLGHDADVWTPTALGRHPTTRTDWDNSFLEIVARRAPSVSLEQAQASLDAHARAVDDEIHAHVPMFTLLEPLQDATVGSARSTLWVLTGAVALLLLTACVNVANLFLARGLGRRQELAVRMALGAGRRGLVRHLVMEGLVLSALGCGVGVLLGWMLLGAARTLGPSFLPRVAEIGVHGPVIVLAAIVAVAAGIAFGLLPGFRHWYVGPVALVGNASRASASRDDSRLQSGLVVAQFAAACVLLVGAGVLIQNFRALQRVHLGFEPKSVITFTVNLPTVRYRDPAARIAFFRAFQGRVAAIAGVRRIGAVDWLPMRGRYHPWGFDRTDRPESERSAVADARVAAGDYFEAAGIQLLAGRAFDAGDGDRAPKVAVVSRSVAEGTYRREQVLGKRIRLLGREWSIVGVVSDVASDPYGGAVPVVYLPHDQFADNRNWSLVQVVDWSGEPAALVARIRAELDSLDPDLVLDAVEPLENLVREARARERLSLLLMTVFAAVTLTLAGVGLYGVLAYSVRERTREIGIRIAIGARPADVIRAVMARAVCMAGLGSLLGALVAAGGTRWLRSLVFQRETADATVVVITTITLALAATTAAFLPAQRATRLDPIRALSHE